jgi:hypothetical protein
MTILKSNSGKMLEYLTIELQSGWDAERFSRCSFNR